MIASFGIVFATWLPLLFFLPWLSDRVVQPGRPDDARVPSLADATRERLWAR